MEKSSEPLIYLSTVDFSSFQIIHNCVHIINLCLWLYSYLYTCTYDIRSINKFRDGVVLIKDVPWITFSLFVRFFNKCYVDEIQN